MRLTRARRRQREALEEALMRAVLKTSIEVPPGITAAELRAAHTKHRRSRTWGLVALAVLGSCALAVVAWRVAVEVWPWLVDLLLPTPQ